MLLCVFETGLGGTDCAMTPSPSLFFLSASPCLKGLGLALGKNKEGEGVMEMGKGGCNDYDWGRGAHTQDKTNIQETHHLKGRGQIFTLVLTVALARGCSARDGIMQMASWCNG